MPPSPLAAGQVLLARYALEREIGAGGMATVWLARDQRHDRLVAVKVLRAELSSQLGAERFLREVRISAQLQHPHILTLIDSGEADGRLFYVMPYVEGESLRARLDREGALPAGEVVHLLGEVLDALGYAHAQGLVHRDLKPENVMLSGRHALVMDFGVAKAVSDAAARDETLTAAGMALGTPAYMAPEQATGDRNVDRRADLYGAGVMAYEMLAGERVFAGVSGPALLAAHIASPPVPLAQKAPTVPPGLAAAVMRALEKDPDARWQDADAMHAAIAPFATSSGATTPSGTAAMAAQPGAASRRGTRLLLAATAGLLVLAGGWWARARGADDAAWARETGVPALREAVEQGRLPEAWRLARRIGAALPADSTLQALAPRYGIRNSIRTTPAGAQVWRRDYAGPDTTWELLGTTPLDSVLLPRARSRLRVELAGHEPLHLVTPGIGPLDSLALDPLGGPDSAFVRVPRGRAPVSLVGIDHVPAPPIAAFRLARHEVTNAEYRRFIDAGGYAKPEYWEHSFRDGAATLDFAQAMARFVDRTGRPGPATWEGGSYPAGQDAHPVAGLSWYEAAAYARFAGATLPTVFHWARAAMIHQSGDVAPASNFARQGTLPVGARGALNGFGTTDMGGNVREWVANATSAGDRFILGGGWNDQPYQFTDAYAQPPMDRSPINGLRLARLPAADTALALAGRTVDLASRDYARETPVPDAIFDAYRRLYAYDPLPLDATIDSTVEREQWTSHLVRFAAAYGNERMAAYLFLPKRGTPPYRTVVLYPGSNVIFENTLNERDVLRFDFLLNSGRAVVLPVFKGTLLRRDSLNSDYQQETAFYRDHVIMWARDLGRTIDYLATRPDISLDGLGYYGISWGGAMGGIMPAVEPRIKVNVLYVAGLMMQRTLPEVDPWNFIPRVTQPTLMLNGRYDFFFPLETSQKPMFAALGAPAAQKRHVVADGGHDVPREVLIKEVLDWLDRYQPGR